MKRRQVEKLGVPRGEMSRLAIRLIGPALKRGLTKLKLAPHLKAVASDPDRYLDDPYFGPLARAMAETGPQDEPAPAPRDQPAPWRQWGEDLDPQSIEQMRCACELPVSVAGALMPDAHVGYGLPIGGVLATENAVIPYAVGVDIACRMKLTVLDLPTSTLKSHPERLIKAIETETRFGIGAEFGRSGSRGRSGPHGGSVARSGGKSGGKSGGGGRRDHDVMDQDWNVTPITRRLKDKAHAQLGTSGSGNHFVEFGLFSVDQDALGLDAGVYLALLSHSGSRGTGAQVCDHYSRLAMDLRARQLPKPLRHQGAQ